MCCNNAVPGVTAVFCIKDIYCCLVRVWVIYRTVSLKWTVSFLLSESAPNIECICLTGLSAGKSDLTVDALKLHNDLQSGQLEVAGSRRDASMEEDAEEQIEGLSDRTSGTFLSGLSDCSNLTFRKVQRYWESNSAAHKEVWPCGVNAMFS